jgi:hypothetical protein
MFHDRTKPDVSGCRAESADVVQMPRCVSDGDDARRGQYTAPGEKLGARVPLMPDTIPN